jgi:hypothetical protein
MRKLMSIAVIIGSCLPAFSAVAAVNGTIFGKLQFKSELGGYCDQSLGMDCTHAYFLPSMTNSIQPVRQALIDLVDQNGQILGAGSTDNNGNFGVAWFRASGVPTSITVRRWVAHKDSRFWHAFTDGASIFLVAAVINNPPAGNFDMGTFAWSSFDVYNNNYDAALRSWENSLQFSADMLSRFTEIRIVMHATATGAPNNRVEMADSDVKRPLSALSHELGHVVSYIQRNRAYCGAFNYPTACVNVDPRTSCKGVHRFNSPSHRCVAYEEGLAQFLADTAFYGFTAKAPIQCPGFGSCGSTIGGNTLNFETSVGTSCSVRDTRKEVQVTRYLWDAYDTIDDPGFADTVPAGNAGFRLGIMIDTLDGFPAGFNNGQADEPWKNASLIDLDDPDGKSASDFKPILDGPENTNTQYQNNCSP